ncbi:hypothetical protein WMY93_008510 [Mugilogobius chulae]|uniref:Gypsy retrotransposon integrase-like protein 1 n=1 Tax=Mugilogobius chulae TaxID=88201 RepID=A0AAW0PJJ0_9GOBI
MATFDLEAFVSSPTLDVLESCRKCDLIDIARHYDIPVSVTLRVGELRETLLATLVSNGILVLPGAGDVSEATAGGAVASPVRPGLESAAATGQPEPQLDFPNVLTSETDEKVRTASAESSPASVRVRIERLKNQKEEREREFQLKREIELKRLELEAVTAREVELKKLEAESALRMRQLELQAATQRSVSSQSVVVNPCDAFDVTKNIQLVPVFREAEVESYFGAFERIASALHWPRDVWAVLLQCKLSGKASEACASLSVSDSLNYDKLKTAILRAYELVPEAYRQRFRGLRKSFSQSFVDFAREKSLLFDRWCSASKVSTFASLRELLLIEEFKNCLPERILVYLNEQKVSTLQQAAISADEFALTHKAAFTREPVSKQTERPVHSNFQSSTKPEKPKQCFYCHKFGHLVAECETLKRKQPVPKPKGVNLIKTVSAVSIPPVCSPVVSPDECFKPFIFEAFVSVPGEVKRPVMVLRDTGGSQSFILSGVLPLGPKTDCHLSTVVKGIGLSYVPAPLHNVHIESKLVSGIFPVAVRDQFPVDGVDFIMGNDIAGGKVYPSPEVVSQPIPDSEQDELSKQHPEVFSVSVLTRAQAKKLAQESDVDLCDSVLAPVFLEDRAPSSGHRENSAKVKVNSKELKENALVSPPLTCEALIEAQKSDSTLTKCFSALDKPDDNSLFFFDRGVLMRKWVPRAGNHTDNDWCTVFQIVVPKSYRQHVLSLAHEHLWSGHLGVTKTYNRVLQHFFWPGLKADVVSFCKTCSTCQSVGKPNQVVPPAPLRPVPAVGEPFEHVIVDCVGPLPKTKSGNQFLLTIMCVTTRFPEAIPLRKITAPSVTKALTKFFTTFGLPRVVQTDQGTNFLSKTFKETLQSFGVTHSVSSAYHPESQGALERWHQTLKSMLSKFCFETGKDWDEGVPFMLFAIRDATQESLGFSPAELVFGHSIRGPLKVLKEQFLSVSVSTGSVSDFVSKCRERLQQASVLAKEALFSSQASMKKRFDKKAVARHFKPGDKVLVLLPTFGSALSARFSGPYVVEKQVSDTNYLILTPERRRKTRLCHVNMLKPFHVREEEKLAPSLLTVPCVSPVFAEVPTEEDLEEPCVAQQCGRLSNSEFMSSLGARLSYLSEDQLGDIVALLQSYPSLLGDTPSRTSVLEHDIDVCSAAPIKQHAYRCPLPKREAMKKEVQYLLENGLAKPSHSPWSSPCLLAPKSDGTPRFCTDFRKVNAVTVPDSFPLPRMEDCIDNIGPAVHITKLDLLKGYWQVPLTSRASDISAFVTPDHFMQYTVMAFGMRNAPATFQRLMHVVLSDVSNCNVYLDDIVVYSDTWASHVNTLKEVFKRLSGANLTLNLAKCEFGRATVTYLGKVVGHGHVRPVTAKVEAVLSYPAPRTRRELRRFLGLAGYYRCFCKNFSVVVAPLTALCSSSVPYIWTADCECAFQAAKSLLCSAPVLSAPDYSKPFTLEVDASATGAGAVLLQKDEAGVPHPVSYFSSKFKKHQLNYSTIEKETLAMLLALQHFNVYVCSSNVPVSVSTDHNPLVFLAQMYNQNQRLMRWALLAQGYNITIQHKKGADTLWLMPYREIEDIHHHLRPQPVPPGQQQLHRQQPTERRVFMNTCDSSSLSQQWIFERTNSTVLDHFNRGDPTEHLTHRLHVFHQTEAANSQLKTPEKPVTKLLSNVVVVMNEENCIPEMIHKPNTTKQEAEQRQTVLKSTSGGIRLLLLSVVCWRSSVTEKERKKLDTNLKRVAEVWMDEYAEFVYQRRPEYRHLSAGDMAAQKELRAKLNSPCCCLGKIRNVGSGMCMQIKHFVSGSPIRLDTCVKSRGESWSHRQVLTLGWREDIRVGDPLHTRKVCFDAVSHNSPVTLYDCHGMKGNQLWRYRKDRSLYHPVSNSCIDSSPTERRVFMNTCDSSSLSQQWIFERTNSTVLDHFNRGDPH